MAAYRKPQRETAKASSAFSKYCALGPERSLTKLAEQLWREAGAKGNKDRAIHTLRNQLGIWSSQHKWQERVKEYDRQQIEKKRKEREKELEKLNDEQASYGRAMSALAMKQIKTLIDAQSFNAQSSVLLFKYATDLERSARGAASESLKIELSNNPEAPLPEANNNVIVYLPRKDSLLPAKKEES